MQQPWGQIWNSDSYFKWGEGHHWTPLSMALFLLYEYGFVFVCNLGLFEITEWEPCMWLLNTDFLAGNAARQWHCW